MTRTPRRPSPISFAAVALLTALVPARPAPAAPPWLEGLGAYRIVDASGRIAPRTDPGLAGRVALRPAYPPSPLMRARPLYLSGYAGAVYGPGRFNTTSFGVAHGHAHGHRHADGR